ncbi:MAG: RadC family protein [Clostridia bacterium]|nr:RadC family protein [Clostridia bacterium]
MAGQPHKPGTEHEGHRQRMKERFLANGLDGFSDHEILELLLFYAIPYRDTNPLAHELTKRFGSWMQVVNADYRDLLTVPGVTPHVASLLTLTGQAAVRYYQDITCGEVVQLLNADHMAAFLIPWFLGQKDESVVMVSLDNKRKVLNTTRIFEGSVNSAQFNVRLAVQQALRDNATQIVLAHNHPNGFCFPSEADVSTTKYLVEVLKPLQIRVVDHLIISEGDCLCMSLLESTRHLFQPSVTPLPQVAD